MLRALVCEHQQLVSRAGRIISWFKWMKLAGLTHGGAVSLSLASALKKSKGCKSFGLCGELKYIFMHF